MSSINSSDAADSIGLDEVISNLGVEPPIVYLIVISLVILLLLYWVFFSPSGNTAQRLRQMFFRLVGLLGIGAALGAWLVYVALGTIDPILTDPAQTVCEIRDTWADLTADQRPKSPNEFRIILARLERDADGNQTAHIAAALENMEELELITTCRILRLDTGIERQAAIERAENRGRNWLKARQADLLIWGERAVEDKSIRVRYLYAGTFKSTLIKPLNEYILSTEYSLPENFTSDLGEALFATVVSAAASSRTGTEISTDALRLLVQRFGLFIEDPSPSLPKATLAKVLIVSGLARRDIGLREDDNCALVDAVLNFKRAATNLDRSKEPLDWAEAQYFVGMGLSDLARKQGKVQFCVIPKSADFPADRASRYRQAIEALNLALTERTRGRAPELWAETQVELGIALRRFSLFQNDPAMLKASIQATRSSIEYFTLERDRDTWAALQNNLANALDDLGNMLHDDKYVYEAIAAYRAALTVITRADAKTYVPLQHNLGVALTNLGQRRNDASLLREAVNAFRAANDEDLWARNTFMWRDNQFKLGQTLAALGRIEKNAVLLQEAIAALQELLTRAHRLEEPISWADTEFLIGEIQFELGTMQKNTQLIRQAIVSYQAALRVYRQEGLQQRVTKTEERLRQVQGK